MASKESSAEWNTFLNQVRAIEKKDSNMTSDQQIQRLHKPGSKYLNLNPFYVSCVTQSMVLFIGPYFTKVLLMHEHCVSLRSYEKSMIDNLV